MTPLKLSETYQRLEEIIRNEDNKPLNQVGSYIVGATLVQDGVDQYFAEYPELERIAELGADLEWQGKEHQQEIANSLKSAMENLRQQITRN